MESEDLSKYVVVLLLGISIISLIGAFLGIAVIDLNGGPVESGNIVNIEHNEDSDQTKVEWNSEARRSEDITEIQLVSDTGRVHKLEAPGETIILNEVSETDYTVYALSDTGTYGKSQRSEVGTLTNGTLTLR